MFQTTFYFSPLSKIPVALLKLGSPVKVSVKPTGTATLGRSAEIYTVLLYRTSGRLGGYKRDMKRRRDGKNKENVSLAYICVRQDVRMTPPPKDIMQEKSVTTL